MPADITTELLCESKNGVQVYYDPLHSHATTHFQDTPQLQGLVCKAIAESVLTKEKEHYEFDFKTTVGTTDLLETTDTDTIMYAKRLNRDNYSRFVLHKQPAPESVITLVLYKNEDTYLLYSAWIGNLTPSFPGAPTATADSIPFWRKHALIWGKQQIQPGSEVVDWPWR